MPLDAAALARALELSGEPSVRTMLCQKELAQFSDRAAGDVVVACTQEARLFGDIAEEGGKTQAIRFVNIRETGGWSADAKRATPKIAALLAQGPDYVADTEATERLLMEVVKAGAAIRIPLGQDALWKTAGGAAESSPRRAAATTA